MNRFTTLDGIPHALDPRVRWSHRQGVRQVSVAPREGATVTFYLRGVDLALAPKWPVPHLHSDVDKAFALARASLARQQEI